MSFHPAIDVSGLDTDLLLALVDDFSPSAVQEESGSTTIYFTSAPNRDAALAAILDSHPTLTTATREIDDEDWARRSQANLTPITIGRITVYPSLDSRDRAISIPAESPIPNSEFLIPNSLCLTILPSMGFGTGHHATTRLCLRALQQVDLSQARVLDIGAGSGVLAMAARLLGAADACGIDVDPDAVQSARENLALNPHVTSVRFECQDLRTWLTGLTGLTASRPWRGDLVTANLTGALLMRSANLLIDAVRPGGLLILSGVMQTERVEVGAAFASRTRVVADSSEDEWIALVLQRPLNPEPAPEV